LCESQHDKVWASRNVSGNRTALLVKGLPPPAKSNALQAAPLDEDAITYVAIRVKRDQKPHPLKNNPKGGATRFKSLSHLPGRFLVKRKRAKLLTFLNCEQGI